MRRRKSIVFLTALYSAVFCAAVCVLVFVVFFQMQRRIYENRVLADVEENITKISSYLFSHFYGQGNWVHLQVQQGYLHKAPNILYSYIVSPVGTIDMGLDGIRSPEVGDKKQTWEPDLPFDVKKTSHTQFRASEELSKRFQERVKPDEKVTLISTPITCYSSGEVCAQLRVAVIPESIVPTLAALRRSLIIAGILLTLSTAFIVFVITRRNLLPIQALAKTLRELATRWNSGKRETLFPNDDTQALLLPKNSENDAEETHFFRGSLIQFTAALKRASNVESELNISRSLSDLARQVAHDIRSPLAALDAVTSTLPQIPEEKRIILRSALSRIRDIANGLLNEGSPSAKPSPIESGLHASEGGPAEERTVFLLSSLIDGLVSEKRMQFRTKIGVEIECRLSSESYGLFVEVPPTEFKRVLSNLINNAVDAIEKNGNVIIDTTLDVDRVTIWIKDNGKGIPPHILPTLMQKGATYDKKGGLGLGLYHAKNAIESWGGNLRIESSPGEWTNVILSLPQAYPPEWFVPELNLKTNSVVVILDDDSSIHQIWQDRFDSLKINKAQISALHFSTPQEFTDWFSHRKPQTPEALYLIDHEFLGFSETGLSLIEKHGIEHQSILVTSRFEEIPIREICARLRIRMIPKGQAGFVPITIERKFEATDGILIDDDGWVCDAWVLKAREMGKNIRTFSSPEEFLKVYTSFNSDTPVFVDANLGGGVRGEEITRELSQRGFRNIYLATGYEASHFAPMPWLKGIIGKDLPEWLI